MQSDEQRDAGEEARRATPGEAAVLVHRADRHGDPVEPGQAADPVGDLLVSAAALPVLPRHLPGLEELGAPQSQPERVLYQAAQGSGPARQGPLLDHRPVHRVHVRGGQLPAAAARLPPQVSGVEAAVSAVLFERRSWCRRADARSLRESRRRTRRHRVPQRLPEPVSELPGVCHVRAECGGVRRLGVPGGPGYVQVRTIDRRGDLQDHRGHVQDRRRVDPVGLPERRAGDVQKRARSVRHPRPGSTDDVQAAGRRIPDDKGSPTSR